MPIQLFLLSISAIFNKFPKNPVLHKPLTNIYADSKDKGDFLSFAMFLQSPPASCPLVQGEYLKLVHVKCHWDKITRSARVRCAEGEWAVSRGLVRPMKQPRNEVMKATYTERHLWRWWRLASSSVTSAPRCFALWCVYVRGEECEWICELVCIV